MTSPSTAEKLSRRSSSVFSEKKASVCFDLLFSESNSSISPGLEPLCRIHPYRHGHLLRRSSAVLPQPQHLDRLSALKLHFCQTLILEIPNYLLSETLTNRLFERIPRRLFLFYNRLSIRMARGALIIFEGVDRSGKSTQIKRIFNQMVNKGERVYLTRFPEVSGGAGMCSLYKF